MKKFILLMMGRGVGCDYTIGCNRRWELFSKETVDDAVAKAREMVDYYGADQISSLDLIEVADSQDVSFILKEIEDAKEVKKDRETKEKELKLLQDLQKKYPQITTSTT